MTDYTYLLPFVPLCGWDWYRWSQITFTQKMFDELGIEVSINGRAMPAIKTSNGTSRRKEIMSVVRSYR